MQDKRMHNLRKTELLTIIYEQQKEIERLKNNVTDLEKQLSDRTIKLEEAGSIAEASLKLNKIFEVAQEAADQYLESIKKVNSPEFQGYAQSVTNDKKTIDTEAEEKIIINTENNENNLEEKNILLEEKQNYVLKDESQENLLQENKDIEINEENKIDTSEKISQIKDENSSNIYLIPLNRDLTIIKPKLVERLLMFFAKFAKIVLVFFSSLWKFIKNIFRGIIVGVKKVIKILKKFFIMIFQLVIVALTKLVSLLKKAIISFGKFFRFLIFNLINCLKIFQNKAIQFFYFAKEKLKNKIVECFKRIKKSILLFKNNVKEKKEEKNKEKKYSSPNIYDFNLSSDLIKEELDIVKKKDKGRRFLKTFIFACVVIVAIAIITATSLFKVLQVNGSSMEPSLKDGELLITSKFFDYKKGDMIAFYYNDKVLIKRVIATEGDTVLMDDDGTIYINNKKLEEDYLSELDYGNCNIKFPFNVPNESIFVLGDNRKTSLDSRNSSIGCIKKDNIIGKIKLRLKPFKVY